MAHCFWNSVGAPPENLAWVSRFNAVTARTAGFNISDMAMLSSAATAVMIVLMFIGGSPGGFAGGIKTTTFALSVLNLFRISITRRDVELFGRRLDDDPCNRAFAVLLLSLFWTFVSTTTTTTTTTTIILFLQPRFRARPRFASASPDLFSVDSTLAEAARSDGRSSAPAVSGTWDFRMF